MKMENETMDGMKTYIGTKAIMAIPMTRLGYNRHRGWELPQDEDGDDAGFLVEYTDGGTPNHPKHRGYISWSPEETFHKAYREIALGMTFGHALEFLKAGHRMQRSGWNGKGMWVWLHTPGPHERANLPYLMLNYPAGSSAYPEGASVPWLASQTDLLSTDWMFYDRLPKSLRLNDSRP